MRFTNTLILARSRQAMARRVEELCAVLLRARREDLEIQSPDGVAQPLDEHDILK
jgi:hypothetical protein